MEKAEKQFIIKDLKHWTKQYDALPQYGFISGDHTFRSRRIFQARYLGPDSIVLTTTPNETNDSEFEVDEKYITDKFVSFSSLKYAYENQWKDIENFTVELFTIESYSWIKKNLKPDMQINSNFKVTCDLNPNQIINTEEKTMLDTILSYNKDAVKTATTLTATKAVTEIVTDKLASVLPAEASAVLNTPFGALLVANLAAVGVEMATGSLSHKTEKAARQVTEAMAVNAMQDILAQFDLPGLITSVMSIPEVSNLLSEDEANINVKLGI